MVHLTCESTNSISAPASASTSTSACSSDLFNKSSNGKPKEGCTTCGQKFDTSQHHKCTYNQCIETVLNRRRTRRYRVVQRNINQWHGSVIGSQISEATGYVQVQAQKPTNQFIYLNPLFLQEFHSSSPSLSITSTPGISSLYCRTAPTPALISAGSQEPVMLSGLSSKYYPNNDSTSNFNFQISKTVQSNTPMWTMTTPLSLASISDGPSAPTDPAQFQFISNQNRNQYISIYDKNQRSQENRNQIQYGMLGSKIGIMKLSQEIRNREDTSSDPEVKNNDPNTILETKKSPIFGYFPICTPGDARIRIPKLTQRHQIPGQAQWSNSTIIIHPRYSAPRIISNFPQLPLSRIRNSMPSTCERNSTSIFGRFSREYDGAEYHVKNRKKSYRKWKKNPMNSSLGSDKNSLARSRFFYFERAERIRRLIWESKRLTKVANKRKQKLQMQKKNISNKGKIKSFKILTDPPSSLVEKTEIKTSAVVSPTLDNNGNNSSPFIVDKQCNSLLAIKIPRLYQSYLNFKRRFKIQHEHQCLPISSVAVSKYSQSGQAQDEIAASLASSLVAESHSGGNHTALHANSTKSQEILIIPVHSAIRSIDITSLEKDTTSSSSCGLEQISCTPDAPQEFESEIGIQTFEENKTELNKTEKFITDDNHRGRELQTMVPNRENEYHVQIQPFYRQLFVGDKSQILTNSAKIETKHEEFTIVQELVTAVTSDRVYIGRDLFFNKRSLKRNIKFRKGDLVHLEVEDVEVIDGVKSKLNWKQVKIIRSNKRNENNTGKVSSCRNQNSNSVNMDRFFEKTPLVGNSPLNLIIKIPNNSSPGVKSLLALPQFNGRGNANAKSSNENVSIPITKSDSNLSPDQVNVQLEMDKISAQLTTSKIIRLMAQKQELDRNLQEKNDAAVKVKRTSLIGTKRKTNDNSETNLQTESSKHQFVIHTNSSQNLPILKRRDESNSYKGNSIASIPLENGEIQKCGNSGKITSERKHVQLIHSSEIKREVMSPQSVVEIPIEIQNQESTIKIPRQIGGRPDQPNIPRNIPTLSTYVDIPLEMLNFTSSDEIPKNEGSTIPSVGKTSPASSLEILKERSNLQSRNKIDKVSRERLSWRRRTQRQNANNDSYHSQSQSQLKNRREVYENSLYNGGSFRENGDNSVPSKKWRRNESPTYGSEDRREYHRSSRYRNESPKERESRHQRRKSHRYRGKSRERIGKTKQSKRTKHNLSVDELAKKFENFRKEFNKLVSTRKAHTSTMVRPTYKFSSQRDEGRKKSMNECSYPKSRSESLDLSNYAIVCDYCGRQGHNNFVCKFRLNNVKVCYNCSKFGHYEYECRKNRRRNDKCNH